MKLVWSPERASKAYIDTVKSCEIYSEFGVAELLSAMAAGWNAKLIVETWSYGGPVATSVGLAIAAGHTGGRHLCIVADERSRSKYVEAMREAGVSSVPEIVIGDAEAVAAEVEEVDFLVADCRGKDFARVLRVVRASERGAVLVCKNAWERKVLGFRWQGVLRKGTRVVKSVFLPVGRGLEIAHIGSAGGSSNSTANGGRWIKHVDLRSGEEHVFRE
ncbi:uncharacterized protein LOC111432091 [Cucurbita moschata]|uniref:Uncharacterized protein LOC111432091 n=1 Tax=Cucurbita moschata TaxID=3662 RepID=A0A6J1ED45_CUCMO|nr:uncharacterized protein LOC111432091 [Cucurbita moschata]